MSAVMTGGTEVVGGSVDSMYGGEDGAEVGTVVPEDDEYRFP